MGKYVVSFLCVVLFMLGVVYCYTGEFAYGNYIPRSGQRGYTVVPGWYLILLSVVMFVGYQFLLKARKKKKK